MKTKKGISPLIATVLLIGFTVALAAVIMTWGLDYIKKTTEKTGETTEEQLSCANDLQFEIIPDCTNLNQIEIDALKSKVDIAQLLLRLRDANGNVITTRVINQTIPKTGTHSEDIDLTNAASIDVLASIKLRSGKVVECSQAAKTDQQLC